MHRNARLFTRIRAPTFPRQPSPSESYFPRHFFSLFLSSNLFLNYLAGMCCVHVDSRNFVKERRKFDRPQPHFWLRWKLPRRASPSRRHEQLARKIVPRGDASVIPISSPSLILSLSLSSSTSIAFSSPGPKAIDQNGSKRLPIRSGASWHPFRIFSRAHHSISAAEVKGTSFPEFMRSRQIDSEKYREI